MQLVLLVKARDGKHAIALERDVYLELGRRMAERMSGDPADAQKALAAAVDELERELITYGESLERSR